MLFKKKCYLCKAKIDKGKEVMEIVKIPEFCGFKEKPFCSKKHAVYYDKNITGTPSNKFCCGIPRPPS